MDWKKILQWVTFILNLIVYFGIVNIIFLAWFRLIAQGFRNPWISWGIVIVQEALLFYLLWRYLYREIMLTSPEKRKERSEQISRTVTAFRYAGLTILAGMLFLVFLKIVGCFDVIYAGWPLLFFPAGVVAAVLYGIFRPKKRGSDGAVSLLRWSFLLGIPAAIFLLEVMAAIPGRFEYRTSELRPWRYFVLPSKMIQQSFPPEAKKCHIRGTYGFGLGYFWSCECPEEAFLRFARKNGYELHKNEPSSDTGMDRFYGAYFGLLHESGLEREPDSYYYCNNRWPNGGGWTLLYDRNSHILYGNYADR